MRIGLFGGTFNPPHAGHVHASEIALKYLGLDAVWWLVTPGNPLKPNKNLPSIETRLSLCRDLINNPRIIVTGIESNLGTIRTVDTVKALQSHFPATDFVWFAGTDIAYQFPKWYKWRELQTLIPFAFVGRPTEAGQIRQNCFRMNNRLSHTYPLRAFRPPLQKGQVYWIFSEPLMDISSTLLRSITSNICDSPPNTIE